MSRRAKNVIFAGVALFSFTQFEQSFPLVYLIAACQYVDMVCIYCSSETRVVNSRHQKRTNKVWRRRTCLNCGTTFTSLEGVDLRGSITVRHMKQLQPFERDKLFLSVHDSLKHRKTAQSDSTGLTDTIISLLYPHMRHAIVEKTDIIEITLKVLKRFDKVAATHYQAFHK